MLIAESLYLLSHYNQAKYVALEGGAQLRINMCAGLLAELFIEGHQMGCVAHHHPCPNRPRPQNRPVRPDKSPPARANPARHPPSYLAHVHPNNWLAR